MDGERFWKLFEELGEEKVAKAMATPGQWNEDKVRAAKIWSAHKAEQKAAAAGDESRRLAAEANALAAEANAISRQSDQKARTANIIAIGALAAALVAAAAAIIPIFKS